MLSSALRARLRCSLSSRLSGLFDDMSVPPVPPSSVQGYVNPNVLSSMTYHKMGTTKSTGTTTTTTYMHEANNAAYTFTNKFTISMWIQPTEIPSNNGLWLFARYAVDVSGEYIIRLEPQTVGSAVMYSLAIYNGGASNGYVHTKKADSAVLQRPFGHILINYDGTRTANDRIRFYVNGVDYTVGDGNVTAATNFASTLPANSRDIHILGSAFSTDRGFTGGVSHLQVWNDDKWASRATIWNNGVPLPYSQLGALDDSTLKRAVDFDDTIDESSSSQQYFRCKKNNVNAISPRRGDNGAWLAQPTTYFASRINNLSPIGGYWSWRFGSMPELLHTSLRSTATTGLYNYGILRTPLNNFSRFSSWAAVEAGRYTGTLSAISSATHGDAFCTISHTGLTTGTSGSTPIEQFFMGTINGAGDKYVGLGIFPDVDPPPTLPMLPGLRARTDVVNSGIKFVGVNMAVGNKRIHHFGCPSSRGVNDTYYRATELSTGTTTSVSTPGGMVAQWFGDVSGIADFALFGYNQGTATYNGDNGIFVWGSGWNTTYQNAIRTWIAKQYGVTA